jgi:UDP-N-acetylglucosamine/UDP-N-acetylgalactosamine diphosphorylase
MAGGTSRKDHSEVGSSYIHFNYTPNQDKATASLIGDVAHGVMLNQPPIFLGGQGGLVGPSLIGYNTVIAAGVIYRGDCPKGNKLLFGKNSQKENIDFYPGIYWSVKRRVLNSIEYIANIIALRQWYTTVRSKLFQTSNMDQLLYKGALAKLDLVFNERIKRFNQLATKMKHSLEQYKSIMGNETSEILIKQKKELFENYQEIENIFRKYLSYPGNEVKRKVFLKKIENNIKKENNNYIKIIKNLDENTTNVGINWLSSIINKIRDSALKYLPSFT